MNEQRFMTENGTRTVADRSYTAALRTKYSRLLEGIPQNSPHGRHIANVTAILLENQMGHLRELNEETLQGGVGSFTKYIFPILRRVFPNLIAHEIMSVQPMTAPIGAVFTYEYKYSNTKGSINEAENLIETFNEWYSAEYIDEETVATGDAAKVAFSFNLSWTPVRPQDTDYGFVVTVTDGTETFTDNGSGVLTGDAGGSGTINYTTGEVTVTFNAAPGNGQAVTATYYYNSESNSAVPEVEIDISMSEVRAQTRKLKARWSAEAADDLRAFHGIDAETEMVAGISNEIALEIDREMIDLQISGAQTTTAWAYNPATTYANEMDSIRNLLTLLSQLSAKVHRLSKRAPANYIVTSPEVVALLEQLTTHGDYRPAFVSNPNNPFGPVDPQTPSTYGPLTSNFGVMRVGTLMNKWAVYMDPFLSANTASKKILLGLKGASFMDAGSVYAPYIPLQVTPTFLDPNDFSFRKGMRTRYAKKLLRPEYYATVDVTGLPT
jgi:hypothetical protein